MDFLGTLKEAAEVGVKVVKNGAKIAAEKSSELLEESRVRYRIFELKGDIKKLYNELGRLTYNAVESGEDSSEDIKMKCDIITAKLAKIEVLAASGKVTEFPCPNCGRKADATDTYCPTCGADMTVDADVEVME